MNWLKRLFGMTSRPSPSQDGPLPPPVTPTHPFLQEVAKAAPGFHLREGADSATLAPLAAREGLPVAFLDLLRAHDGQVYIPHGPGVFFGLEFMGVEDILRDLRDWAGVRDDVGSEFDEFTSSHPEGAIQSLYSHPDWVPFANDGGGNYLAIDLAPGPHGTVGQVINFGRDEEAKYVVADSFQGFLDWMTGELRAGRYRFGEDDGQRVGEFNFPDSSHFLDAARRLFGPEQGAPGT